MPLYPALGDAYRKVVVTQGLTEETTTAKEVAAEFNLDAGFGITLVTDVENNKVTIVNTGNGTGALTTITDNNSLGTFYPIFTRAPDDAITFTAGTVPPNNYVTADVPIGVAEIRITGSINDPTGVSYELRTALTGLVTGETFQGVKVSDSATLNFVSAGPATYNTLDGYWTVPIDTANLSTETLSSITIATGTGNYNQATGTYQMDTMYLDQTTTPLTYNPNTNTITVSYLSGVSFTMSGHVTLEGVTSTGSTGTGKFVFDNAPTITGHPTIEGVTSTGSTGTGNLVFDNTPTLITPILGVASATSINKVAITAPTTSATITILDGKVFTVNNTITLQGTDSTVITLPGTTGTVPLDNQQFYIGTTALTINRTSAAQSLTGITSIDGYASNLSGGNNTTLLGSIHYQSASNVTSQLPPNTTTTRNFLRQTGDGINGAAPAWDTVTATDVGLGNVTNESKATMFTNPTFTGTVSGVTSTHVGLGNVTNESKATMFTSPTFTGTVSGVTATHVGLGNVTNESKSTMFTDPTFTGHPTLEGITSTGATGTGKIVFDTSPTISGTLSVSAGNVNATQYTACSNIAGNTMSEVGQKTTSVSTGATTILTTPSYMTFAMVAGTDGTNRFSDIVLMSVGTGTVNVISSLGASGTPAVRTYSQSSSSLRLAMASGTYTVSVYAFTMTP
jgi:hypothetical protein